MSRPINVQMVQSAWIVIGSLEPDQKLIFEPPLHVTIDKSSGWIQYFVRKATGQNLSVTEKYLNFLIQLTIDACDRLSESKVLDRIYTQDFKTFTLSDKDAYRSKKIDLQTLLETINTKALVKLPILSATYNKADIFASMCDRLQHLSETVATKLKQLNEQEEKMIKPS